MSSRSSKSSRSSGATSEATLSIRLAQLLVAAAERTGVPRARFLRAAKLDAERLEAVDGRLTRAEVSKYCQVALDLTGDPAFGLHWGEWLSANSFTVVSHLLSHAETLRQAFATLFQFGALLADDLELELIETEDEVVICWVGAASDPLALRRMAAEMAMIGILRLIRQFSPNGRIRRACFAYPAPAYRAEYARVFESAERFDQPFTGLVFDRALMDAVSPIKDEELHSDLRAIAARRIAQLKQRAPYAAQVREHLLREPAPHRVTMSSVARALGLSVRSLHRRLADSGESYSAIANDASATVAKRLLADDRRSIKEVAFAVGFSDVSSFHRAFKRWTGATPNAFRARR